MRDPKRLNNFYRELCDIHQTSFPDFRFGQFCSVFFGWLATEKNRDLFFPEEDEMIDYLKEYARTNGMFNREVWQ